MNLVFFLSRERKNDTKKNALIFLWENVKLMNTGCCHYTEQRQRNIFNTS